MKIATKIAVGYAILIALIVAVLAYQITLVHQMHAINRNLYGTNFRAAIGSLQLLRDLDQVEEFTQKLFATGGDPDYDAQLEQMQDAFTQLLQEINSLALSPEEKQESKSLAQLWEQLLETSSRQELSPSSQSPGQKEVALSEQLAVLGRLRTNTQRLVWTTRRATQIRVEEAARTSQRAEGVSWAAALVALMVSLLVSVWIVRSISKPLRRLAEGTRAVAEEKFSYRLEETGHDELAQLARDFNTMTRRLSELDGMKKDFVSHVSHELKSPLASIQEAHRLLLEELPGPLNEPQRRLLELNLQSAQRLSSLIGNLLDLSRIEAGVMHYDIRKHDLGELLRTVVAEFELPARERGLRIESPLPQEPAPVDCDGDRMMQVFGNIVANALKFSPPESAIRIGLNPLAEIPAHLPPAWRDRVSGSPNGEGFALVSISDSGPGIPAAEREKIFEKFHQIRQETRVSGQGAGLGLAIGRTIVEAHRGAIWVKDNPSGGSVFYILLAVKAPREPTPSPTSSPISGSRG